MPFHSLPDTLQNLGGSLSPDIGGNEGRLELFQKVGINLLTPANRVFELLDEPRAGFLNAGLEAFKETRFGRRSGRGAEEGLKHGVESSVYRTRRKQFRCMTLTMRRIECFCRTAKCRMMKTL